MRRWRQKVTRRVIPVFPAIFCWRPEEDTGHLRITCEQDEVVARLLCAKLEEFTADPPLADRAMEFMSWKEHGCKWTESLMAGVVLGDLRRLFAMVRAASSQGPAKAKLFPEDMILMGDDGYARRNHRLTRIMQLPPGDPRKATYSFLRGDTPLCPPAGRVRQVARGTPSTAYRHGGRSRSLPDPKGRGGDPPPSTDPKIVVRNNVLCRRQRRRRFCFRHRAGGNFFVRPYVSVLKILRILWRIQKWLKSTKKDFDPNPASGSDLG